MIEKEIIEGNKLIAEFMGESCYGFIQGSSNVHRALIQPKDFEDYEKKGYVLNLEYRTSWDWLMPVVEKIETISIAGFERFYNHEGFDGEGNFNVIIQQGNCSIRADLFYYQPDRPIEGLTSEFSKTTKIQAVWLAVVEFIKWYKNSK